MRTMRRWLVVGVVALAAVALLVLGRPGPGVPEEATRVAARVGESLRTGRAAPDTFDVADADAQLVAARRGLGTLLPEVVVRNVVADAAAGTGSAVLDQRWVIHEGKPAWVYTTTVPLRVTAAGWRALWSPSVVHTSLSPGDRLRATRLAADRGEVIGAGGTRLVHRQAVQRVFVDLARVDRATAVASARQAAQVLGIDPAPLVDRVLAAPEGVAVEVATLRTLDVDQRTQLERVQALPGVGSHLTERMLALSPTFARPFLGTVGAATADAIAAAGGDVREGDQVGLSGLQAAQDRTLRGTTGFVVQRVDAGERVTELFRVEPVAGASVTLALDAAAQERADRAVLDAPGATAVVVLRPADGHVLAAASNGADGVSIATQGRFPLGATPAGLASAVAPLRWGTSGQLGVPAFLGEAGTEAWASALGLAQAAASQAAGETVIPVLVAAGRPARPSLSDADRAALAALVAQADARPEWAVLRAGDLTVVAYAPDGDPDALARASASGR